MSLVKNLTNNYLIKYTTLVTMITMGSTMAMNSNSLFTAWVGMEMNLMGFIPLMSSKSPMKTKDSLMIYFIIQSLSSSMFIMSSLMTNNNSMIQMASHMMVMTMATKLGMAPIFMWMPLCAKNMSFMNLAIMLTWQKLAPMSIMAQLTSNMKSLTLLMTAVLGPLMGMTQKNTKMILTSSSISHMAWMVASTLVNSNMWMKYLIMYSISMLLLMALLSKKKISSMNQLNQEKNMLYKMMISMTLLSTGGMPPLLGFFPKWMVLSHLSLMSPSMSTMLVLSSTVNMYIYSRMMIPMVTMSHSSAKTTNNKLMMTYMMSFIITSLMVSSTLLWLLLMIWNH